jgi:hypothetical protein
MRGRVFRLLSTPVRLSNTSVAIMRGSVWGSVGLGAGLLALFACTDPSPSPQLTITAPTEFAHESVVLIEDPAASQELTWVHGEAQLAVPKSGVARLKSLGPAGRELINATLNGRRYWHSSGGPLHGRPVLILNFEDRSKEPAPDLQSEAKFKQFLRERETEN